MAAYPEPDGSITVEERKRSTAYVNSRRVCIPGSLDLLKLKAWMMRVLLKQSECLDGISFRPGRESAESFAKLSSRTGFDQRSSSRGRVSPRANSSRAASASRSSLRSLLNLRCQDSSSEIESRICDAIASCSSFGSASALWMAFSSSTVTLIP